MPKRCKCGGTYVPRNENRHYFTVKCDKCGTRRTQHKRKRKEAW